MKQLLVVHPDVSEGEALGRVLSLRQDGLGFRFVDSLDSARRELKTKPWDAVLLTAGLTSLSLASFLTFVATLPAPPRVMSLGEALPGVTTLEPGAPERVVDQLFVVLGLVRSASFDSEVLESVGFAGAVEFARVKWPGAVEPLLRAQIARSEFDPVSLAEAQRAGQLSGPGLATTLEVFWDDPRPHLLQAVPSGVSLARLQRQRSAWGVDLALSIARGLAEGIATLHAADFSAGTLRGPSIWLTEEGDVLLLGHGLTQVPYTRQTYYGLPSEAPPEEYGTQLPPKIPGDAFRLGILLMQLAVNDSPVRQIPPVVYLQRDWRPVLEPYLEVLGPAAPMLELLLQPEPVDRPRGALLRQVIDEVAPRDRQRLIREAVTWSKASPDTPW